MKAGGRALLAALAIGWLIAMLVTGARPTREQFVAFEAAGVMTAPPERVQQIDVQSGERRWRIERRGAGWHTSRGTLTGEVAARVTLAVKFLHTARPVRTLTDADSAQALTDFGLHDPALRVGVTLDDGQRIALAFGARTPDRSLQYLRVEAPPRVVLMSNFVGEEWQAVAEALR